MFLFLMKPFDIPRMQLDDTVLIQFAVDENQIF